MTARPGPVGFRPVGAGSAARLHKHALRTCGADRNSGPLLWGGPPVHVLKLIGVSMAALLALLGYASGRADSLAALQKNIIPLGAGSL